MELLLGSIVGVGASIGAVLIFLVWRMSRRDQVAAPEPPRRRTTRIVDLVPPGQPALIGQTFEDMHFTGPAFIKFQDRNRVEFCNVPDRRALLPLAEGSCIVGAIVIWDCTFRRCYFEGISIVGTMDDLPVIAPGFDQMPVERWEAAHV